MFLQAPVSSKCAFSSSLQGSLPDKKHDKHEKVNESDSSQLSGSNGTGCEGNDS